MVFVYMETNWSSSCVYIWENGGKGKNEEEIVGVRDDGEEDGEYLKGFILNPVSWVVTIISTYWFVCLEILVKYPSKVSRSMYFLKDF